MNQILNTMIIESCHADNVTLYRGLNDWQLKSTPDQVREHYHKKYLNQRLVNKNQHAFLEIPNQLCDTDSISMKFRQKNVFPTESAWISLEKDIKRSNNNVVQCKKSEYINTGGPVKLLSWCPKVSVDRQILAVYVSNNNDKHKLEMEPLPNNDYIQIWDFGSSKKNYEPKLMYSFKHQWGNISSMQWVSPDAPNIDAVKKSLYTKTDSVQPQSLYGHILFCCTDGFMRICPIPHFSDEQLKSDKRKILQFNTGNILKLGLGHDYLNDGREFFGYPTSASWNSLYPKWFVAGYSSGHIGIFDLSCVNLFHYDCVHHYLISIHKRRLSYYPVTGITISPSDWQVFNYTVDSADPSQCNFIYKFTERTLPVVIIESDKVVKSCLWPSRADLLVSIPVTSDRVDITSIISRKMVSIPIDGIVSIVSLNKDNSILVSRDCGSVELISLNDESIINKLMLPDTLVDGIKIPKMIRQYRLRNSKTSKSENVKTLVDCTLQRDVVKLYDSSSSTQYPRINAIDVNPNISSIGWAAIGLECGVVHLLKIGESDLDLCKVGEKFSTAMKFSNEPELSEKSQESNISKSTKTKVRNTSKTDVSRIKTDDIVKGNVRKSKPSDEKKEQTTNLKISENKTSFSKVDFKPVDKLDRSRDRKMDTNKPVVTDCLLVPYNLDEDISMEIDKAPSINSKLEVTPDVVMSEINNGLLYTTDSTREATDPTRYNTKELTLLNKLDDESRGKAEEGLYEMDELKGFKKDNSIKKDLSVAKTVNIHSGLMKEETDLSIIECETNDSLDDIVHSDADPTEEALVDSIWEEIAATQNENIKHKITESGGKPEENIVSPDVDNFYEGFVNLVANDIASLNVQEFVKRKRELYDDIGLIQLEIKDREVGLNESSDDTEDISVNVIDCSVNPDDSVDMDPIEEVKEIDSTACTLEDEELDLSKSVLNESNKDSRIQVIFDDSDLCVDYFDFEAKEVIKPAVMNEDIDYYDQEKEEIEETQNTKEIVKEPGIEETEQEKEIENTIIMIKTPGNEETEPKEEIENTIEMIKTPEKEDTEPKEEIENTIKMIKTPGNDEIEPKEEIEMIKTPEKEDTEPKEEIEMIKTPEKEDTEPKEEIENTIEMIKTPEKEETEPKEDIEKIGGKDENEATEEKMESFISLIGKQYPKKYAESENISIISGNIFEIIHKSIIMPGTCDLQQVDIIDRDCEVDLTEEYSKDEVNVNLVEDGIISIDLIEENNLDTNIDSLDNAEENYQLIDVVTVDYDVTAYTTQDESNIKVIDEANVKLDYQRTCIDVGNDAENVQAYDSMRNVKDNSERENEEIRQSHSEIINEEIDESTKMIAKITKNDGCIQEIEAMDVINDLKEVKENIMQGEHNDEVTVHSVINTTEEDLLAEELTTSGDEKDISLILSYKPGEEYPGKIRPNKRPHSDLTHEIPRKKTKVSNDENRTDSTEWVDGTPAKTRGKLSKSTARDVDKSIVGPDKDIVTDTSYKYSLQMPIISIERTVAGSTEQSLSVAATTVGIEDVGNLSTVTKNSRRLSQLSLLSENEMTVDSGGTMSASGKRCARQSLNSAPDMGLDSDDSLDLNYEPMATKYRLSINDNVTATTKTKKRHMSRDDGSHGVESSLNQSVQSTDSSVAVKKETMMDNKKPDNANERQSSVTNSATKKSVTRKSVSAKPWQTRKIVIAWTEGKFKGIQQSISGKLLDEEPIVGQIAQVRWSKPSSQRKYPARIIEIML